MNPELRPFVLYAAPAAVVVLILGIVIWSWSGAIAGRARRLEAAHHRYQEFYLGDEEQRLPAEEALALAQRQQEQQAAALAAAEESLVAPLPAEYTTDRFTNDSGLHQRLLVAIRNQAERSAIPIPRSLPLEGGLNPDSAARSLEMAQLYLLQQAMRALLSGAARIDAVDLDDAFCDPDRRYAVLTLDFRLQTEFRAALGMIRHLGEGPEGIGLRGLRLRPLADDPDQVECTGSISLLTPYDERWNLPVAAAPTDDAGDTSTRSARRRPSRGR